MKTKSIQCWAVIFHEKEGLLPELYSIRDTAQVFSTDYNKEGCKCAVRKVKITVIKK